MVNFTSCLVSVPLFWKWPFTVKTASVREPSSPNLFLLRAKTLGMCELVVSDRFQSLSNSKINLCLLKILHQGMSIKDIQFYDKLSEIVEILVIWIIWCKLLSLVRKKVFILTSWEWCHRPRTSSSCCVSWWIAWVLNVCTILSNCTSTGTESVIQM